MALRGNSSSLGFTGCHVIGGSGAVIGLKFNQLTNGRKRRAYFGGYSQFASTPYGANPPIAILLSPKSGGISMRFDGALTEGTIGLSQGVNLELDENLILSSALNIDAIAFMEMTDSGVLSNAIDMVGVVNLTMSDSGLLSTVSISLSASVQMSMSETATLSESINMVGVAVLTMTDSGTLSTVSINTANGANLTMSASGILSATIGDYFIADMSVDMSVQGFSADTLATAVWSAVASSNNGAGTMGEKLNDAGSASNPWTEVLTDGGYTAAELMRMFAAVLGGKSTVTFIGGVTYQVTFESVDQDAKIVVDATVVNSERTDLVLDLTE